MRKKEEVEPDVISALSSVGDEDLASLGFRRSPRSMAYKRVIGETKQTIDFTPTFSPHYKPDAEVHLYPSLTLEMKDVRRMALELADGDAELLGAADHMLNEPIDWTAPTEFRVQRYATGSAEIEKQVKELVEFVRRWVIPFLDGLKDSQDLVKVATEGDERLQGTQTLNLFLAAALNMNGKPKAALEVMEKKLGRTRQKKQFRAVFNNLSQLIDRQ